MDTLTTPVLLVIIAANSRKARFSVGPSKCYILDNNREHESVFGIRVSVSWKQKSSVLAVSPRNETSVQCSSVSRIQAASAKVFTLIVTCVETENLHGK
jgi:hypothetical protein